MSEWYFLWVYGAQAILGCFLTAFWGSLAWRRLQIIKTPHCDSYFILAAGLGTLGAGLTLVDAGRLIGNLHYGLSPILRSEVETTIIGVGLGVLLVAFFILVWLADLERKPPTWRWLGWMTGSTIAWALSAVVLANWR